MIRGGYGWFYDTLNVNVAGITQTGFSRATSTIISNDFGETWNVGNPGAGVSPLSDPFPLRSDGTRFDTPYGNRLGLMSVAGAGYSYPRLDRKHPRVQRWRIGVQRQFGASMVVEAAYVGSFGDRHRHRPEPGISAGAILGHRAGAQQRAGHQSELKRSQSVLHRQFQSRFRPPIRWLGTGSRSSRSSPRPPSRRTGCCAIFRI